MQDIIVYTTWDEPMADMALGLLKAEGIAAYKRDSGLRSSLAITIDGLGVIELLVPEGDAERACELIEARFSESGNEECLSEDELSDETDSGSE